MTILIKGMEMPMACDDCWALDEYGDYPRCRITEEQRGYNFRIREQRMEHCPLIEVPTPHGRLIDADAMASDEASAYLSAQIAIASAGDKDSEYEALMDINDLVHKKLQMLLKDAPTVIEAEEGE